MKIELPEEYVEFLEGGEVFVSLWKDNSLILMNKNSKEKLIEDLEEVRQEDENLYQFSRFMKSGITETDFDGKSVTIPEPLREVLKGEERTFESTKYGLIIK